MQNAPTRSRARGASRLLVEVGGVQLGPQPCRRRSALGIDPQNSVGLLDFVRQIGVAIQESGYSGKNAVANLEVHDNQVFVTRQRITVPSDARGELDTGERRALVEFVLSLIEPLPDCLDT